MDRQSHIDPTYAVDVVAGAVAVAVGGLLYLDFFIGRAFLLDFAVTVVAATATAMAGITRGWSLPGRLVAAGVGFVVVAAPMVSDTIHGGLPTARTAAELGLGVVGGWAKMLSVGLPAPLTDQLLTTVLLIAWVAGQVTTTLAVHTVAPLSPVLPPVVAFGIGLVMVATQPPTHFRATAALLGAVLAMALWRARRNTRAAARPAISGGPGRRSLTPSFAFASAFGAVAIVAGLLATNTGVLGTGSHRSDPRPLETQRMRTPDYLTPLAAVEPQVRTNPPRPLFDVTIRGGAPPGITVAVLDRFDGTTWTTDDEFLSAGQRLAPDPILVGPHSVTAHVTVRGLASPFLPAISWPVRLAFTAGPHVDLGFSPMSGTLISTDVVAPGSGYDVTGDYRSVRDLGRLSKPDLRDTADQALPPGLPEYVDLLAHSITSLDATPVGKLAALQSYLRGLPYNVDAAPGHSYADIARVLTATTAQDDGAAEQHAAAFAVMARDLGYPARVVVGYRLVDGRRGTFDVTTHDATAWAEVHFVGYGWVAYDPTNVNQKQRLRPPVAGATPSPTRLPVRSANIPQPSTTVTPPPVHPPVSSFHLVEFLLTVVVVLGSVPVLCGLVVLAVKMRRRQRRRRARTSAGRVVGAWEESVDRLIEVRLPMVLSMTPHEYARHATESLGGRADAVAQLAAPATTAVFDPHAVHDEDAIDAWHWERTLRRSLRPGWRRLRAPLAWLHPGPLCARRRARTSRRPA